MLQLIALIIAFVFYHSIRLSNSSMIVGAGGLPEPIRSHSMFATLLMLMLAEARLQQSPDEEGDAKPSEETAQPAANSLPA
ncbi:hypothetical protein BH09PLA1_BH09PLA1_10470 [soil metagenome]